MLLVSCVAVCPAPSGPPININATATSSSVSISWSPPGPLEANGPVIGYTLKLTRTKFGGRTETHSLTGETLNFRKDGKHSPLYYYHHSLDYNYYLMPQL